MERLSDSTQITFPITDPTRTPDPIRITVIENGTRIRNRCCCSQNKEIKMNTPTPFTGKREKIEEFLIELEMYLAMNADIYNTDQ